MGRLNTAVLSPSNIFNNFYFKKAYGGFFPYIDETESLIMEKLYNIYLSRFEYKNLPESLQKIIGNRNFIDGNLFFQPSMAWFMSSEHGLLCLPTSGRYSFNVVGRPVKWTCFGNDGSEWDLDENNSVLMFNDEAMTVPFLHLAYEAGFMRDVEHTARQNLFAQRQPFIIETDEDTLKSAQAEMQQLGEFKPVIFRRKFDKKNPDPIETKVFNTNVPFLTKELDDFYTIRMNRCLTYLGIKNIGVQDKKERLVVAETTGNDMIIQTYFTSAYNQRKKAIDDVNKMFGTNIEFGAVKLETMQAAIDNTLSEMMAMAQAKGAPQKQEKEEENNNE